MKTIFTDLEKDIIKELIMKDVHSFMPVESSERYKLEYVDWSDTVEASSGKLSISYKVTADEESVTVMIFIYLTMMSLLKLLLIKEMKN
jgi:hypothetical protein